MLLATVAQWTEKVAPLILPARAALYSPLGSRSSHTDSGIFMYTSMKSPVSILLRTASRSARYGEMKLTSVITPVVAYSLATSPVPRGVPHVPGPVTAQDNAAVPS
jgi:hypothetical protein